MRLWHEALIPYLPRQQLLGQHRECCALRGKGWGKPHATVNYVFKYFPKMLVAYHYKVMFEMRKRGYSVESKWLYPSYRGKNCENYDLTVDDDKLVLDIALSNKLIYPEHDDAYLKECLDNLRNKGIILEGFDYDQE